MEAADYSCITKMHDPHRDEVAESEVKTVGGRKTIRAFAVRPSGFIAWCKWNEAREGDRGSHHLLLFCRGCVEMIR